MNIRKEIGPIVDNMDKAGMEKLFAHDPSGTLRMLQYFVFDTPDILRRWQALDMMGYLAGQHAHEEVGVDQGIFRNLIRRFIWQMCEEGANVPWASPEVVGSIVSAVPGDQFREFVGPLFFHAGLNEINHAGLFWAVNGLSKYHAEETLRFLPDAIHRLAFDDLGIRAYGAWALQALPIAEAKPYLEGLLKDDRSYQVYENEGFREIVVSEEAQKALYALEKIR